ncbi:asparaginase [Colletotrichum graminicola M1.001]|uniref:Asparaginase n=1 Tax=Colletotrichum graminicola (strain M1.001 / M2 / FGSC 10212) TaxID=645133 RepID=E3QN33_COLGM|nr:asparaginase [Colletotrichum graminicola M1.001]EFQ32271.1 asparaginase [Colletotrichum graminicola M1.001]
MQYKRQPPAAAAVKVKPRLIIHGGAGNIKPSNLAPPEYDAYRHALLMIIGKTSAYQTTPLASTGRLPSALETAAHAVALFEDIPLFNSGHGAVFTRDGINELEASVMVSRGRKKRGVGVTGLRHVRNPILLAKAILEHGDEDLGGQSAATATPAAAFVDVPSAQGHTLLHGETAETLARQYGLALVDASYFFTQKRWDEHVRALERERKGQGPSTWSADEFLPQGTVGAVALDEDGVVCAATSTGGLTNKLTGRIGDTPVVGAGFWAEEWVEDGDPTGAFGGGGGEKGLVVLSDALRGLMADCLPSLRTYAPLLPPPTTTTRAIAVSGTGNGDSFMRVAAGRTVGAVARWKPLSGAEAVSFVSGPGGELQRSAGERWRVTGEGEGGVIGIEVAVARDAEGRVVGARSAVLQDFNCNGMYRAWVGDDGRAYAKIYRGDVEGVDLGELCEKW